MKQQFTKKDLTNFQQLLKNNKKSSKIVNNFYKKTYKYLRFIKWIPWLLMVWVWNSISMNSANKSSDIDLFIITKKNRMWLVRILVTLIFQILWVRKNSKHHAWRFCLSFFATENWLNFWDFALENDIYLYFWIIYLKPVLDYNNTYDKFIKINENWADFSEYRDIIEDNRKYITPSPRTSGVPLEKGKNSKFLDYIDKILKNIFEKKSLRTYEKIWKPYGIIINNNMLKFHNNDKRKQIKKELWF